MPQRPDDGVEAVPLLDRAVRDQSEPTRLMASAPRRSRVEFVFVRGRHDNGDLPRRGASADECLAHVLRARDDEIGEPDTRLFHPCHQSHHPAPLGSLELRREELRSGLLELEKDASAEDTRDDRREGQDVRRRVDLHDVEPTT